MKRHNDELTQREQQILAYVAEGKRNKEIAQLLPDPCTSTRAIVVGLPLRGVRVFRQFAWLEVDSGKVALPRLAHQRVTHTVGLHCGSEHFWYGAKITG